jgi:hypothetical protein
MVPTLFGIEDAPGALLKEDTVLWRYMDQPRFLALLIDKTLHFASKYQFEGADKWEGTIPQPVIDEFAAKFGTGWELMIENFKYVVSRGCVLCWFESLHESVAMWNGYGTGGVAIRTTVQALRNSLRLDSDHLRIARIQYVQHSSFDFGSSGYSALAPMFLKRQQFASEQEVRAIVMPADESRAGIELAIDLPSLIEAIVVSPQYPRWAIRALQKIVDWSGLSVAINTSTLLETPPGSA